MAATLIGNAIPNILAIDNGGTNTRFARGGGLILPENITSCPTPRDYESAIIQIGRLGREALGDQMPDFVGVSLAGAVGDGRITSAGTLEEYGWVNRPYAEDVANVFGIEPSRVKLLNDCVAGAAAERDSRALEATQFGAFMVLSTGFGGALYTPRELIPDEPGHYFLKPGAVCGDGQEGHAEAHISGYALKQKYGTAGENIPHDDPRWAEVKDDFHNTLAMTLERYGHDYGIRLEVIGFSGFSSIARSRYA